MHVKKWRIKSTIAAVAAISVACGVCVVSVPSSVSVVQGRKSDINFGSLMTAKVSEESVSVLSAGNERVGGNLHLDLSGDISLLPKSAGEGSLDVSFLGIIPVKKVSVQVIPETYLIAGGQTVGVTMKTQGVMVLGTGYVLSDNNEQLEPAKGILKSGDIILSANGKRLEEKEDLMEAVEQSGGMPVQLEVERAGQAKTVSVNPAQDAGSGEPKIGVWVRDSTQGIGTVTYMNPETGAFGALGHGVYDVDTRQLMSLSGGSICRSEITGVKQGEKGAPGEIQGGMNKNGTLGSVYKNTEAGLYGSVSDEGRRFFEGKAYPIAASADITEGEATILSGVDGEVKEYSVEILSVDRSGAHASKDMVIRITDERLLKLTGGIVQGMSGSPLVKDGKIIGAVTHVFVNDPSKGYGIFIENMLKNEA